MQSPSFGRQVHHSPQSWKKGTTNCCVPVMDLTTFQCATHGHLLRGRPWRQARHTAKLRWSGARYRDRHTVTMETGPWQEAGRRHLRTMQQEENNICRDCRGSEPFGTYKKGHWCSLASNHLRDYEAWIMSSVLESPKPWRKKKLWLNFQLAPGADSLNYYKYSASAPAAALLILT